MISGVGMCLFITLGAMVYPKPKGFQLPVSVDGCSRETIEVSDDVCMAANKRNYTVDYRPEYLIYSGTCISWARMGPNFLPNMCRCPSYGRSIEKCHVRH